MVIDLSQLGTLDFEHLDDAQTDLWCEKIFNLEPDPDEQRDNLLKLFNFTRGLLRVKSIQTDVLVEEIQKISTRLDSVNRELDERAETPTEQVRSAQKEILRLQAELDTRSDSLDDQRRATKRAEDAAKLKDREVSSLRIEIEALRAELRRSSEKSSKTRNGENDSLRIVAKSENDRSIIADTNATTDDQQQEQPAKLLAIEEKNAQIEQLLDRLYDADRINLDLAEQLAKCRVDSAKQVNELKIGESRSSMFAAQVDEFRRLNESLLADRDRKEREIAELRAEIEQNATLLARRSRRPSSASSSSATANGYLDEDAELRNSKTPVEQSAPPPPPLEMTSTDFYQQLTTETKRLNLLLEAKEMEIADLRTAIQELTKSDRSVLEQKREEIERLEQELAIVTAGDQAAAALRSISPENSQAENSLTEDALLVRQLRRRVRKLRKDKLGLLERIAEMEKEATLKDTNLERNRRQMAMIISGGGDGASSLKQVLEENAVLSRMIRFRDDKIGYLIDQLNRHHLTALAGNTDSSKAVVAVKKDEIPLMDQIISLGVERDVLAKQIDALKTHLSSVQAENLELQLGMKEILEGLRAGEITSDLVIECPSLERVCALLENRLILDSSETSDRSAIEPNNGDLPHVILLKSELDFVRGQNEQLRSEMKQLRADFLAVIDEYTNDILENWTIPSSSVSLDSSKHEYSTTTTTSSNLDTLQDESKTSEDPKPKQRSIEDSSEKSDLLQAYYRQLQQLQLRSRPNNAKKWRSNRKSRKLIKVRNSKILAQLSKSTNELILVHAYSQTTHSIDGDANERTPHHHISTNSRSVQTDNGDDERIALQKEKKAEPTLRTIKQALFDDANLRQSLLDDRQIREFLLRDDEFVHDLLDDADVRRQIVQDAEAARRLAEDEEVRLDLVDDAAIRAKLLEDPRVRRALYKDLEPPGPRKVEMAAKQVEQSEDDASEYVDMFDVGVQVKMNTISKSISTQTAILRAESHDAESMAIATQPGQIPENVDKYRTTFESIRSLIDKERQQVRLQESKLLQEIESLQSNLQLVHSEYRHDLTAREEELRDLRQKLRQSSSSSSSLAVRADAYSSTTTTTTTTTTTSTEAILATKLQNDEKRNTQIILNQTEQTEQTKKRKTSRTLIYPNFFHIEESLKSPEISSPSLGYLENNRTSKSILETIITCLQNCLKQKDEALAEYRSMMDEMRRNATVPSANKIDPSSEEVTTETTTPSSAAKKENSNLLDLTSKTSDSHEPETQDFDKIYRELYIKPCAAQNEELLALLQKAFTELNVLRNRLATETRSYKHDAEQLAAALRTLRDKYEHLSKEKLSLEQAKSSLESQNRQHLERIESLTGKIAEATRRASQQSLAASSLKKKVDNVVYQESADLRAKIAQLTGELKKTEFDRWSIEKRLTAERAQAKSAILERDQSVAKAAEQVSKLQNLIAKLEKRLQQAETKASSQANVAKVTSVKASRETRSTQTQTKTTIITTTTNAIISGSSSEINNNKRVRFEDEQSFAEIEQEDDTSRPAIRTVVIERHAKEHHQQQQQNIGSLGGEIANIITSTSSSSNVILEDNQREVKWIQETTAIIDRLRRELEQSFRREKLSSMVKEVATVGATLLTDRNSKQFREDEDDDEGDEEEASTRSMISTRDEDDGDEDDDQDHDDRKDPESTRQDKIVTWKLRRYGDNNHRSNESILSAAEIYDQLIDMQFERLVSENAKLRVQLKIRDIGHDDGNSFHNSIAAAILRHG